MAQLLQHLINGLAAGTIYALVALGYTMVYGVLKLINFAHGDVMMVGVYMGYATAFALGRQAQKSFLGVVFIFLVAMAGCALLGFLIERFAYRPLREKPRLTALITAPIAPITPPSDMPLLPVAVFRLGVCIEITSIGGISTAVASM